MARPGAPGGIGQPVQYTQDRGQAFGDPQAFINGPLVLPPAPVQQEPGPEQLQLPAVVNVAQAPGSQFGVVDTTRYATVVSSVIAIGTVSALFLNRPTGKRILLGIRNSSSAANIFIDFGTAATTNSFLELIPGQTVFFDAVIPQNDLFAIADAAGGQLSFIYAEAN